MLSVLLLWTLHCYFGFVLKNNNPEVYEELGAGKIFWFGPNVLNFMFYLLCRKYKRNNIFHLFDLYLFACLFYLVALLMVLT